MADYFVDISKDGTTLVNAIPFFPQIYYQGATRRVRFNRGYALDYTQQETGSDASDFEANCVKIFNAGGASNHDFDLSSDDPTFFWFVVKTPADSAKIQSVSIVSSTSARSSDTGWHYHPADFPEDHQDYSSADGANPSTSDFAFPMCWFQNGILKQIVLRENVHWQKINVGACGGTSALLDGDDSTSAKAVLQKWGEATEDFGDNPPVRFRNIKAGDQNIGVELSDDGCDILIKFLGDSDGSDPVFNPPSGGGDDSIGPMKKETNAGNINTAIQGNPTSVPGLVNYNRFNQVVFGKLDGISQDGAVDNTQHGIVFVRGRTHNAQITTPLGLEEGTTNRILTLPKNTQATLRGEVTNKSRTQGGGEVGAGWEINVVIKRGAGNNVEILRSTTLKTADNTPPEDALGVEITHDDFGLIVNGTSANNEYVWTGNLSYSLVSH